MTRLPSLADIPGTSREYETIYIVRPNSTNDAVAEINARIRGIIEERGGKVLKVDNWGKRRLAYEVRKERKGIYLYWQYLAGPGVVEECERNMRMLDDVLRYMTVKLDADVVADARPTEVDDETYEKAASTAADEEDMYIAREAAAEAAEGDSEAAEAGDEKSAEGAEAAAPEAAEAAPEAAEAAPEAAEAAPEAAEATDAPSEEE